MKAKISGNALREKLLDRLKSSPAFEPTEESRIRALASPGNVELLGIVATRKPQSVAELAALAGRLQPNVSRSLSALSQAGLLTLVHNGRTSIPQLTPEGERKAKELNFVSENAARSQDGPPQQNQGGEAPVLTAQIVDQVTSDSSADKIAADVAVRFAAPVTEARAHVDLNEACVRLLTEWWRILYRRENPFKLLEFDNTGGKAQGTLVVESTGRICLSLRHKDEGGTASPRVFLSVSEFTDLAFNQLARPALEFLHSKRRFNRPVESLLRRAEDILSNPADLSFWKCAGALGLSYKTLDDASANEVASLLRAISNEEARLDFASATAPGRLSSSLNWANEEIEKRAKANSLPRLIELRQSTANGSRVTEPWRTGTERARRVRKKLNLGSSQSIGGLKGIAKLFGDGGDFSVSAAGEDSIKGFIGHGDSIPVVIARDEGPNHTAFLASRAIGDFLAYGSREAPITNIYSDRQAVGRAFAAEFIAPADGVVHLIDDEHMSLEAVAEHFGAPRGVIYHQYENNVARFAYRSRSL
jgi:DNA-binding MarR family transcriptional regulator